MTLSVFFICIIAAGGTVRKAAVCAGWGRFEASGCCGHPLPWGGCGLPWRGIDPARVGRHWAKSPDELDRLDDAGLAEQVGAFLARHQLAGRVVCSSFNGVSLLRLARAFPLLRRGYLLDPDLPYWLHGQLLAPMLWEYY